MIEVNIHPSVLKSQETRAKYQKLDALYDKHDAKRTGIFKFYYAQIALCVVGLVFIISLCVWAANLAHG